MKPLLILLTGALIASTSLAKKRADQWDITFDMLEAQMNQETVHNTCISPFSMQLALALVNEGATGKTRKELKNVLPTNMQKVAEDVKKQEVLTTAQSIWINQNFASEVKPTFTQACQKKFDAEVSTISFNPSSTQTINAWCNEKTQGLIPKALDKVDPSYSMILINALHFKAEWSSPFNDKATSQKNFLLADGSIRPVDMMEQSARFGYAEMCNCQIVRLPYKDSPYAMIVVLPNQAETPQSVLLFLKKEWKNLNLTSTKVHLQLPRWESDFSTSLNQTLQKMGVKRIFSNKADFKGISRSGLRVSDVLQKTHINVDEKGTEAAAVTAVIMVRTSLGRPEKVVEMNVNRPFLYFLVDTETNTPIFAGTQTWQ